MLSLKSAPFAAATAARGMGLQQQQQVRSMATLREIQVRLKSVKNIAKITKSMKMIASTKLARAQRNMDTARIYGNTSNAVFKFIEPKPLDATAGSKMMLVACSSDKGLCGAIHSTVSKPVKAECRKNPDSTAVVVVGDKPRLQVAREARSNIALSINNVGKQVPTFSEAASIVDLIATRKIDYGQAQVLYNAFKSAIAYELTRIPVFPEQSIAASEKLPQFELEDDLLQDFVEFTFANSVYHALAEGHASEMSARRTAMENATKNAGEMIDKLTMVYNRRRQASITNDLVDIITGASAL